MYNSNKDIRAVQKKYKLLKYSPASNSLSGEIELISSAGKYIDIFNITILIPKNFPKCFPKVIETGGKIPRNMNRHVMPKENSLCLAVNIEEVLICKKGITLLWFIDKVLVPRLCEEYRVNNGEKYQKEYSHDFGGTWEFLMKKLDVETPKTVLKFVEILANKKRPNGNALCLCNSGKPYRLCHKKETTSLEQLNNQDLQILLKLLNENPYKGVNL